MKIFPKRLKQKNIALDFNLQNLESPTIIEFVNNKKTAIANDATQIITPYVGDNKVLIEASHLIKDFKKGKQHIPVLKDLNFVIREGENVALLGGNGAGKTTTVEILAGLTKATSGDVEYLYEYKNNFLEEIGIQFQSSSYPIGLSVKEIVEFMKKIYNSQVSDDEFKALINIFGLDKLWRRRASALSGGEHQRLNAFLAIIHKPKVLFLDEISTGLDVVSKTTIKEFIKKYAIENNMTIVIVSHDMDEVDYLCDRIILLDKGVIKISMYKDEIINQFGSFDRFIDLYLQ